MSAKVKKEPKWTAWTALELPFPSEQEWRRNARLWLLEQFPAVGEQFKTNSRKLFLTDSFPQTTRSSTEDKPAQSHSIHFYLFNSTNWTLDCVTPVIYALLTGKQASEITAQKGMRVPWSGSEGTRELLSREISDLLGLEVVCEWISSKWKGE